MDEPHSVSLPIAWLGVEETPIMVVNAMVSQFDPQTFDMLILTVGQLTPPMVSAGTQEERAEQLENVAYVPVKPIVRLGLTEARTRELIATLQANLDQLDEAKKLVGGDPR